MANYYVLARRLVALVERVFLKLWYVGLNLVCIHSIFYFFFWIFESFVTDPSIQGLLLGSVNETHFYMRERVRLRF